MFVANTDFFQGFLRPPSHFGYKYIFKKAPKKKEKKKKLIMSKLSVTVTIVKNIFRRF